VTEHPSTEAAISAGQIIELDYREAMRLLASIDHGRVVFNQQALPAIRVVNHLVDDGRVIVRTRLTATVSTFVQSSTEDGVVVAYEADRLDPERRVGWSVVLTGVGDHDHRPRAHRPLRTTPAPVGEHDHGHHDRDPTRNRHRHTHHRHPHARTRAASAGPAITKTHQRFTDPDKRPRLLDVIGRSRQMRDPDLGGAQAFRPADGLRTWILLHVTVCCERSNKLL
jgi:hypothetical protein